MGNRGNNKLLSRGIRNDSEDDSLPSSIDETQNRHHLRETPRSSNLTSFARGRSRAKVKAKARRRAILGKTFNELFCIAMPRPRYRLSTRSRLLSRIKEYLPHRHVYVT